MSLNFETERSGYVMIGGSTESFSFGGRNFDIVYPGVKLMLS